MQYVCRILPQCAFRSRCARAAASGWLFLAADRRLCMMLILQCPPSKLRQPQVPTKACHLETGPRQQGRVSLALALAMLVRARQRQEAGLNDTAPQRGPSSIRLDCAIKKSSISKKLFRVLTLSRSSLPRMPLALARQSVPATGSLR